MPRPARRRLAAALLAAGVLAAHLGLAWRVVEAWPQPSGDRPARLDVAFVRTLQPQAPVAVTAPVAAPAPRARVAPPAAEDPTPEPPEPPEPEPAEPAASAPEPAASEPPAPPVVAGVDEAGTTVLAQADGPAPAASGPASAPAAASAAAPADEAIAAAVAASAAAPPFEWPPSTRLSYVLTGHYRGPVDGNAQVQWLRRGDRYQVHLDVHIGPPFAAIVERQMSSDGRLGAEGLVPRRYDERTRIAFREPRALTLWLDPDAVQLAGGRQVPRPPGVQDAVSQFVQLTWRFTLQPALLTEGTVIELPLALPRRVETWTYDVGAAETLWTPVGPVEAVHVKPRRAPRPGGDLVAEMWFAPTLQYLPVRIVIRQDEQTWIDLMVRRLPEQAEPAAGPAAAAVPSAPSPDDRPRRP